MSEGKYHPWQKAEGRARHIATAYIRRFDQSPEIEEARRGGYEHELRQYVRAAAGIQAKLIAGVTGIGIDTCLYFWGAYSLDVCDTRKRELMEQCSQQARAGSIHVDVPPDAIAAWKADATRPAQSPTSSFDASQDFHYPNRDDFEAKLRKKHPPEPEYCTDEPLPEECPHA